MEDMILEAVMMMQDADGQAGTWGDRRDQEIGRWEYGDVAAGKGTIIKKKKKKKSAAVTFETNASYTVTTVPFK